MGGTEELARAATAAAREGRSVDAERLWSEVLRADPNHPQAAFSLGVHALQRGAFSLARDFLVEARHRAPKDFLILMTLASACRFSKDYEAELEAIDAALEIDPYYLPGLLARGFWFDARGDRSASVVIFRNALKVAPSEPLWPDVLRDQLRLARELVQRHSADYERYLMSELRELQTALPPTLRSRWQEAVAILAGKSQPYTSNSNQLHIPRLPAIPFFDRACFPWADSFESQTGSILAELERVIADPTTGFAPYITYGPGEPVNQWQELNHSRKWSALHLWRSGQPVEDNVARCPITTQALQIVEMAEIAGLCPNAMFSALAPRTRIPPHNGETNARAIIHLPLIVPEKCRYRVGYDQREWQFGRILAFDDTIEHEAVNDSDDLRVVLIFDVWNPFLEPAEREMVLAMTAYARTFGKSIQRA